MVPETSGRMMAPAEVSEYLDIHLTTFYRQWKRWGLKGYLIGDQLRFRRSEVEAWIQANEVEAT